MPVDDEDRKKELDERSITEEEEKPDEQLDYISLFSDLCFSDCFLHVVKWFWFDFVEFSCKIYADFMQINVLCKF